MCSLQTAFAVASLTLALAACAGTPPPGEQANAGKHGKCVMETGSMLCSNPGDTGISDPDSPTGSNPSVNQSISARGLSH